MSRIYKSFGKAVTEVKVCFSANDLLRLGSVLNSICSLEEKVMEKSAMAQFSEVATEEDFQNILLVKNLLRNMGVSTPADDNSILYPCFNQNVATDKCTKKFVADDDLYGE